MTSVKAWTEGGDAIVFQRCAGCTNVWYFHRTFCPKCGSTRVADITASGRGVISAVTHVTRAPTPEWKAAAPYTIVLVDASEGFRLMAHGEAGLTIGTAVDIGVRQLAGRIVPFCKRRI